MKAYIVSTGAVFGLIVIAHVLRAVAEGPNLAKDPWFILITLAAAAFCGWAAVLVRRARQA